MDDRTREIGMTTSLKNAQNFHKKIEVDLRICNFNLFLPEFEAIHEAGTSRRDGSLRTVGQW